MKHKTVYKRAFSLMWLATIQIYWNKKKEFAEEKSSTPKRLVGNTNMAALLMFWDTNMADMMSL